MSKIIITGVAGLLGSRLADWIVDNVPGTEIIGIDDLSGGYIDNVNPKVQFHKLNLVKDEFDHLIEGSDYVFHFAAYAAEGLSPFIRQYNYENNLIATARIVNSCIRHNPKRLIFTSTMAVYGQGNPPFDERDQPNPIDPYGIAKFGCERDIQIAGDQHGLDWCIIRPHNVYGINQNIWDKYRNVLGIWMYQNLNNEPMTIFGDGMQLRAFSYIDDCLYGIWKCATLDSCSKQIINLGGTKETSIKEANEILKQVMGSGESIHLEQRYEVKYAHPTWQKSVDLLGYEDKTSLEDGLSRMWEWAKRQPNRERFVWEKYEVEKGIYSFWKNKTKR